MFNILSTQQIGGQFRAYFENLVSAQGPVQALDYHDLAAYADCPARWHARPAALDDHLDRLDRIVELAAADPEGFAQTYAVPPAALQATENVCPGCGSTGTALRCSKCGVTRRHRQVIRPYSAASSSGKLWKAEMQRRNRFVLPASRAKTITGAANALHADKAVASAADNALKLLAINAEWDGGSGTPRLPVHALISLLPREWAEGEGTIVALVPCRSAHPIPFAINSIRHGLHVRAALELDLLNATALGPRSRFLVAAAELEPPHLVARRTLTPEQIQAGREIYQQALLNIAVSLKEGYWPDYDTAAPNQPGWSLIDPEGALYNQARALLPAPLTVSHADDAEAESPSVEAA